MPERRWRKFRAVRSPVSSAAAGPLTVATTAPVPTRSPSRADAANITVESSSANTARATSRPAMTQSRLTRNVPTPPSVAGTIARVVTSPDPTSSASARRTRSRYAAGSRRSLTGIHWGLRRLDAHRERVAEHDVRRDDVVAVEDVALDVAPVALVLVRERQHGLERHAEALVEDGPLVPHRGRDRGGFVG